MADYKVVDAQQLDGDLTVLADAIRERAGSEGKMAFPHGMAQTVKSIPTGGVTLPALDHPAGKEDVLRGKEYINGSGQKETGSFSLDDEMTEQDALILQISNALRNKASSNNSGTLPPLENPAASTDMATGKELYDQNGNVVTGTLPVLEENYYLSVTDDVVCLPDSGDTTLSAIGIYKKAYSGTGQDSLILRPGAYAALYNIPITHLGDAKPEDVTAGKTFTSASGALLEGTHECEGGVELPELGDTAAQPADMAAGKVLYDDEGNSVTGTLSEATEGITINSTGDTELHSSTGSTAISVSGIYFASAIGDNTKGVILRPGSKMVVRNVPSSLFGDATADQVAKGATFTSAAGLLMEGTHECDGGVTLPTLTNPGAASDLARGKELIDQDGNVVTGTLYEYTENTTEVLGHVNRQVLEKDLYDNGEIVPQLLLRGQVSGAGVLRENAWVKVSTPLANLGNAAPDQVAKGATFTSAAGLLAEGTMEAASGGGLAVSKGNTSSPTIETDLSSIDYFVLMADSFSTAGLMQLLYRKPNNAISYILCTSYTSNSTKTELNHASMASSTLFTIDGGTVTWNGTGTSAFMSGESYMWLAFGTE